MAIETVKVIINGQEYEVPVSMTILEACKANEIHIPTMCYHARLQALGRCKVCVVETLLEGDKVSTFKLSCSTKVSPGMKIWTNTPATKAEQRAAANAMVERQRLANEITSEKTEFSEYETLLDDLNNAYVDDSSKSLVRNMADCIDCGRCVVACRELQGMGILNHAVDPNAPNPIDTQMGLPLEDTDCITCGQCAAFCPTGAISERDESQDVLKVIKEGKKTLVVSFAPSTRVAISEEFGLPAGTISTGKMVAALRALGFQYVFDTDFAADLTIMEEGHEFLDRLTNGGVLPMFTSCCPGWVDMVEKCYPEIIPHLSSCKSPQQMQGAMIKTYWAEKVGVKPEDIYSVSIMPCTAKKRECVKNDTMSSSGAQDVDVVLTTRELGKLIRSVKVPFQDLEDSEADHPLGDSTGAAVIFGVTGGVMEAALRTVYEKVVGKRLEHVEFEVVRGLQGIKEGKVDVAGTEVSVAVANGGKSVRQLTEKIIADGMKGYHFVEMMACPAGCIGGGGQPRSLNGDVLNERMKGIYHADDLSTIRRSHDSPDVIKIYEDYLKEPLGHRSHKLLHTHYTAGVSKAHALEESGASLKYPDRIVVPAPTAKAGSAVVPGDGVTVLYSTNTGTATEAAEKIQEALVEKGFRVYLARMSDYKPEDIEAEEMIIFCSATMGAGDFTEDARQMWQHLSSKTLPNDYLANVKFAVFGLGSSGYEMFCRTAARFEERLLELGGNQIIPRASGDEMATEKYFEALEPWLEELPELIPRTLLETAVRAPYRVIRSTAQPDGSFIPPRMSKAKIIENKIITPKGYEREVRFIKIDLDGSGLTYHAGDHIGILPKNTTEHTEHFLKIMNLDGKQNISIIPTGKSTVAVPAALSVFDLVRNHLDVFGRPTRAFFQKLAEYATDEAERDAITKLGSKVSFRDFFQKGGRFVDVFEQFPSARPPLGALVDMIPFHKDRLYSIASAPSLCGNVVELVIVLDRFNTEKYGWRTGITTDYLWEATADNEPVFVRLEKGNIMLPEDPELPIVLCGLGTGIAPMRSLLQHRMWQLTQGIKLGPAILYYSVRHQDKDYFFENEWQEMKKAGALTDLVPVFSHDTPPKLVFVQDIMAKSPQPLWDYLGKNAGYFFFCGPAAGVPGFIQDATEKAFAAVGGMSEGDASAKIAQLKEMNRYIIESCGGLSAAKPK